MKRHPPTTTQLPPSAPSLKQQKIQSVNFSEEDWKIFQEAIVQFAGIQREIFQDLSSGIST